MATVKTKDMIGALKAVMPAVPRYTTILPLRNVLMTVKEDGLHVIGSDIDNTISTRIDMVASVIAPGTNIMLPEPAYLLRALRQLAMEHQDVDLYLEGTRLRLQCGPLKLTMAWNSWDDVEVALDATKPGQMVPFFSISLDDITVRLLKATAMAMSTEETRYYLNGVCLEEVPRSREEAWNTLYFTATDGHRLIVAQINPADRAGELPETDPAHPTAVAKGDRIKRGYILPRGFIQKLSHLLQTRKPTDPVGTLQLCWATADAPHEFKHIRARAIVGNAMLGGRLIDGTFPDYRKVMPAGANLAISFDRRALMRALVTLPGTPADRMNPVSLDIGDAETILQVRMSPDFEGDAVLALPHERIIGDKQMKVGFNRRYLMTALQVIGNAETVTLHLQNQAAPCTILPGTRGSVTQVLMPMRV